MRTAIISAIYGASDEIKRPFGQHNVDCEYLLITDDAALSSGVVDAKGWQIIYEPSELSPVRAAKIPKLFPWRYTDAPTSVWVDGSIEVRSPNFAKTLLDVANPLAIYSHPDRDCLFAEADTTLHYGRYRDEWPIIEQQVEAYESHPKNSGLWASGIIARRHTDEVKAFSDAWSREINRYSYQDQISLPYVANKTGLVPASIPYGDIWKSDHHRFISAGRHR